MTESPNINLEEACTLLGLGYKRGCSEIKKMRDNGQIKKWISRGKTLTFDREEIMKIREKLMKH